MSAMIAAIVVLALLNFAFKAVGPAIIGDREFPPRTRAVVDALPAALLAGLLAVDLLGAHWVDADWTILPGLAVGGYLSTRRWPQLVCVLLAIMITAGVRIVT